MWLKNNNLLQYKAQCRSDLDRSSGVKFFDAFSAAAAGRGKYAIHDKRPTPNSSHRFLHKCTMHIEGVEVKAPQKCELMSAQEI